MDHPSTDIELRPTGGPVSPSTSTVLEAEEPSSDHNTHEPSISAPPLNKHALWSLAAQHLSTSFSSRGWEFASYIYLIQVFPDTLLPASISGFCSTGAGLLLAGFVGNLVDNTRRLRFVRACIVVQKVLLASGYAVFLVLLLPLGRDEVDSPAKWSLFALVTVLGGLLNVATIAMSTSIERDWVTVIAGGETNHLTTLNTYLRRIDLFTKLLSPLFVSLLTTAGSYPFSVAFLLGFSLISMLFEFVWINVVYNRIPVLASEETTRMLERAKVVAALREQRRCLTFSLRVRQAINNVGPTLRQQASDWREFIISPVFPSSLAISLLYCTVLSFDGPMLAWLKSHSFTDSFVAGMRCVGVVTGLLGTVLMPWLEKRVGLIRAGSWSLTQQVLSLVPVLLSFFVGAPPEGERSVPWNAALLFTGLALSRIGLWSYDLVQIKELQTHLHEHPRKNSIMALQFSCQNIFDLAKYVIVMVLSRPSQFKYAALVSFISVVLACFTYLIYVRRTRGHLVHFDDWSERLLKRKKKT